MADNAEQFRKAESPRLVTELGKVTEARAEQPQKVCSATAVRPVATERFTFVSAAQPRKTDAPRSVTESLRVTNERLVQPQKAPAPMDFTFEEASNVRAVNPTQSLNAPGAMAVTLKRLLLT